MHVVPGTMDFNVLLLRRHLWLPLLESGSRCTSRLLRVLETPYQTCSETRFMLSMLTSGMMKILRLSISGRRSNHSTLYWLTPAGGLIVG